MESESDPLTRRAVDLFEKEPLKGNSEVHLHTPTKFGEDRSKDLGGDREQTDRQTNRQTDKRCSIYSMMINHGITLICVNCLPRRIRCIAKLSIPTALLIGRNLKGSEISILRKYGKHQAHTGQTLHLNLMRE